jgi:hypothetical protein
MAAPKSVLRVIFMLVSVMFMVTLLLFVLPQRSVAALFRRCSGAVSDLARLLHAGKLADQY